MKQRFSSVRFALPLATLLALAACNGDGEGAGFAQELVAGPTLTVGGSVIQTYARMEGETVTEAGLVVPYTLIANPPGAGTGPLGSHSVDYPAQVQQTTFLNHVSFSYNPQGHPPTEVYGIPHFDIHAYSIPVAQVRAIAPGPDPQAPAQNRIPEGYVYPGQNANVPEMGVHAFNPQDAQPPFVTDLLIGFYNGSLIFFEPMVIRERFQNKESFTLNIAVPQVLGRATRYPTRFTAQYIQTTNTYRFIYHDFVSVSE